MGEQELEDLEVTQPIRPPWPGRFFGAHEFDCHDGTPYPAMWIPTRLVPLVTCVADPLRDRWAGPLLVQSGYRTLAWNARVRGAERSQHVEGRAADLRPLPDASEAYGARVERLWRMARAMWEAGELPELGGLGHYPALWIHVDTDRAADGHLREWTGTSIGSERTA